MDEEFHTDLMVGKTSKQDEPMDVDGSENSDDDDEERMDEDSQNAMKILKTSSYRTYLQTNIDLPNIYGWDHTNMINKCKTFILKLILAFIDLKTEGVLENDVFNFLQDLNFEREMRIDSIHGKCL